MGKSYIKDKFVKQQTQDNIQEDNIHRKDEMPKNKPSKYITTHCSAIVEWLQEPNYCRGHKIQKNGHRIVSGLVRAKTKQDTNKIIEQELNDDTLI